MSAALKEALAGRLNRLRSELAPIETERDHRKADLQEAEDAVKVAKQRVAEVEDELRQLA